LFLENSLEKHGSASFQDFGYSKELGRVMPWGQESDPIWLHGGDQGDGKKNEMAPRLPKERCLMNHFKSKAGRESGSPWEDNLASVKVFTPLSWWGRWKKT
jgi:hypothetical protein